MSTPKTWQQEQFGDAYVHAVATCAGCTLAKPPDLCKVDWLVRWEMDDSYPVIDLQLKAPYDADVRDTHVCYTIDKTLYDALRSTKRTNPLILVIIVVERDMDQWIEQTEEQLSLRKCAYWISLRGYDPIESESFTVKIPRKQQFTPAELCGIMKRVSDEEPL
jgi:hypothetical protein